MKKQPNSPALRFSPTAWAKLIYLRDLTANEVGGFGITDENDVLFVNDIAIVRQSVSPVTVSFDDIAVADFFDTQVDLGRKPEQFARIWIHCHPGKCPYPSDTDETTFRRVFGRCDWSLMAIVAQDNSSYARLRFKAGPGSDIIIPVCVDYHCEFSQADHKQWKSEYQENVKQAKSLLPIQPESPEIDTFGYDGSQVLSTVPYEDILMKLDAMEPEERQAFLDELSCRSEFWDEETEVFYE